MSHLGRPSEEREPQFSMKQLESHLAEISGVKVTTAPELLWAAKWKRWHRN